MQSFDAARVNSMMPEQAADATLPSTSALDAETHALVRLAAVISAADEPEIRRALTIAADTVRVEWVEEVLLQSYLFAGFPRALNATREWRRISGHAAPETDPGERYDLTREWHADGERTCAIVYGQFYSGLRRNIRDLHPALDAWMITEGYGKVLSRPQLDLKRRELCIVAACALARQDRQLHSHLHGALNAGASTLEVSATLASIDDLLADDDRTRFSLLLNRVVAASERHSTH
jgi:4-carboxymuconolactone decarboxylase